MKVSVSDKMASGYGMDGIEVAETSLNMKSDEFKGLKEGITEEDGMKHNINHYCNVHCISSLEVLISLFFLVDVWHDIYLV